VVQLYSDGYVEVYGPDHVDVRVVNRLHIGNPANASDVDAYHERQLPQRYREVMFPRNLRAAGQCRKITPEQEAARLLDLALLRAIQELRK
jgi:hypothetical protein